MTKKTIFFIGLFSSLYFSSFSQTLLQPDIYQKVVQNVFEVVVLKEETDNLTYEKPLPLQFIPFSIRNDKYLSIGTAFLLKDGQFYSAAHVFNIHTESLYKDYFLRDTNGTVYKIDLFTQFSVARDFVVFTAEGFTFTQGQGLVLQERFEINTEVFSAGNALGEGIVIRNGILTSQTFESENGEWKWLRFSAAASPGNSGGPLINKRGEVLGIITMKSQNENLNYALPINEMQTAPKNTGTIHQLVAYSIPNIQRENENGSFDYEITLPLNYKKVQQICAKAYKNFTKNLIANMSKKYGLTSPQGFTKANGSTEIMFDYYVPRFPCVIVLSENKKWSLYSPKEVQEHKLPENGMVQYGDMIGLSFGLITKPDSIPYADFITSPKQYMDYFLSASRMYRTIGSESITITSYGEPSITATHTDAFERQWFVNYWQLDFTDAMTITYALPMPQGLFIITKTAQTSDILNGHNHDIAFLTDFVYGGYITTIKHWNDFFSLDKSVYPLYEPFASMKYKANDTQIYFETKDFSQTVPQQLIKTDKDTTLAFGLAYFFEKKHLKNEVRYFTLFTKPARDDYKSISLHKTIKPITDENKKLNESWDEQVNKKYPYEGKPFMQNNYTYFREILTDTTKDTKSLYGIVAILYGKEKEDAVIDFAAQAKQYLKIIKK
ncbi:MAG: trypsin-like peptidase domain-containing protein [Treponemataceae bacterium]